MRIEEGIATTEYRECGTTSTKGTTKAKRDLPNAPADVPRWRDYSWQSRKKYVIQESKHVLPRRRREHCDLPDLSYY